MVQPWGRGKHSRVLVPPPPFPQIVHGAEVTGCCTPVWPRLLQCYLRRPLLPSKPVCYYVESQPGWESLGQSFEVYLRPAQPGPHWEVRLDGQKGRHAGASKTDRIDIDYIHRLVVAVIRWLCVAVDVICRACMRDTHG